MPRARLLKPGFFTNDELANTSAWGRLLYAGLWTLADREGRLEDRAKRIKASIFPYDDLDIDQLLDELAMLGFIVRYTADGKNYIAIPTFLSHQTPHYREAASTIPAPPEASPRPALGQPDTSRAVTVTVTEAVAVKGSPEASPRPAPGSPDTDDAAAAFKDAFGTITTFAHMGEPADYESARMIAESHGVDEINAAFQCIRLRKKSGRVYVSELWRELEPEEPRRPSGHIGIDLDAEPIWAEDPA